MTYALYIYISFVKTTGAFYGDSQGAKVYRRIFLLNGVFDLPAKCLVQETIQFNGEYGCSFCEIPGKTVATGKGHTKAFARREMNDLHEGRTHERVCEQAKEAEENKEKVNVIFM